MNKTANYQLNQWAKSDRVLMEDFNADNVKLDAALKANADAVSAEISARISAVQAARDACPLVVLRSVTLSSNVSKYDLDLTGFDWSLYGEVTIYLRLKNFFGKVLLNGLSGNTYYYNRSYGPVEQFWEVSGGDPYVAACKLACRNTGFNAAWYDHNWWAEPKFMYYREEGTPRASFHTMNFNGPMQAGSRFTILGVRA